MVIGRKVFRRKVMYGSGEGKLQEGWLSHIKAEL